MQKIGKIRTNEAIALPFKTEKNKVVLKLHRQLYKKNIINSAAKEEPDFIKNIVTGKKYYILELKKNRADCLSFLNYLIYSHKNK